MAAVLSQVHDKHLRPVAYMSKKFSSTKANYGIYKKQLLAIVTALKELAHYLRGTKHTIEVRTDHGNLQYFKTVSTDKPQQARWAIELKEFDFKIKFVEGKTNGKPDALTRMPGAATIREAPQTVLREHQLAKASQKSYLDQVRKGIRTGKHPTIEIHLCEERDNKIFYRGRELLDPADEKATTHAITQTHNRLTGGHPGPARTLDLVRRGYVWQGTRKQIERYIQNCHTCQTTKPSRSKTLGLLEPLPVPRRIWKSITLDFITGLPEDGAMDAILVVVDRFSKMAHFIPTTHEILAEETAELLLHHVWKLHRTPEEIISDQGPQFVSALWKRQCQRLSITRKLSTAHHPQTDGQTE
jgi:hypothetical protein